MRPMPILMIVCCLVALGPGWAASADASGGFTPVNNLTPQQKIDSDPFAAESALPDVYTGTLRVYVVEIASRWLDYDDEPFHNAVLDIPLEQQFSLGEGEVLSFTTDFDGNPWYSDIQADNIMMIAVVSSSDSSTGYSYPPDENPFPVHNADAAAGGTPLLAGMNVARNGFTHTVFVEDVSSGW